MNDPRISKKIFDDMEWTPSGSSTYDADAEADADACLLGVLQIGSTMFHVEAIRVVLDGNGVQEAEDCCLSQDFAYIGNLCGDGPLSTIKIKGRKGDYVVAIYPFAT